MFDTQNLLVAEILHPLTRIPPFFLTTPVSHNCHFTIYFCEFDFLDYTYKYYHTVLTFL